LPHNPRRALISVSDKKNVVKFAKELVDMDWEIISTGGTFKELHEAGIDVLRISDIISFPEILDGRVKTLHPMIHAGILAKKDNEEHIEELKKHNLGAIDLVAVNLYPFEETMKKEDVTVEDAIENIDIGGPTMIRSAAKNHESVIIVIEPSQYDGVLAELKKDGDVGLETRRKLALEAFSRTAEYDAIISQKLGRLLGGEEFPSRYILPFKKVQDLRYGENPYQTAAFYSDPELVEPCIANSKKLKGKGLSFNNILDIDATLELVKDFEDPTVAIVKHMNPSGVASAGSISKAFEQALGADSLSAYGGIVAMNQELDVETAISMRKIFLDCIIAPSFHPDTLPILEKKRVMLLETGEFGIKRPGLDIKRVTGGMLVQSRDLEVLDMSKLKTVTKREATEQEMKDMIFGWKVVKHVKSNAIVLAKDLATVGVGAGQMSRVGAVEIAVKKAGENAIGAVMASDAFFPFKDSIEAAVEAGITAIIHPGGSIRDQEVIDCANENDIAMVFTGMRCLKH